MGGQRSGGLGIAGDGFVHQLLRQGTVFLAREHPGQCEAAEQVDHDIQAEIDAPLLEWKFGDVPGPDLIRLQGDQSGHGMMLCRPLFAPVSTLPLTSQQAIHSADRTEVVIPFEKDAIHLRWRLITKLFTVQKIEHLLLFLRTQGPGLPALGTSRFRRVDLLNGRGTGIETASIDIQGVTGHTQRQTLRFVLQQNGHASSSLCW